MQGAEVKLIHPAENKLIHMCTASYWYIYAYRIIISIFTQIILRRWIINSKALLNKLSVSILRFHFMKSCQVIIDELLHYTSSVTLSSQEKPELDQN